MELLLVRRYAKALFEAAADKGAVDAVAADVAAIDDVLSDAGIRGTLLDPTLAGADRRRLLDGLAKGRHELVGSFLKVLEARHRAAVLPELHEVFRGLVMESRGEVEGVVETPKPLGEAELEQVKTLAGKLTGKTVTLEVREVPELLGGIRLRVGTTLFDGTLAGALQQLEKKLMTAPLD